MAVDHQKRERALIKLLRQIEVLERSADDLLPEQIDKCRRKSEWEKELNQIQKSSLLTNTKRNSQISTHASDETDTCACSGETILRVSVCSRNSKSSKRSSFHSSLSRKSLTLEEDPLGVEDLQKKEEPLLLNAQTPSNKKWHVDVRPFGGYFEKNHYLCLQQIRGLSVACFGSDSAEKCSKRGGWHLTVLGDEQLLGFIVYKIQGVCLSIRNIAVPVEQRRKGYGKEMIRWAQSYARKQSNSTGIECVSLSSLKEAVPFYKAMGFRTVHVERAFDEDCIPGQVYMEYPIRKRKKR